MYKVGWIKYNFYNFRNHYYYVFDIFIPIILLYVNSLSITSLKPINVYFSTFECLKFSFLIIIKFFYHDQSITYLPHYCLNMILYPRDFVTLKYPGILIWLSYLSQLFYLRVNDTNIPRVLLKFQK